MESIKVTLDLFVCLFKPNISVMTRNLLKCFLLISTLLLTNIAFSQECGYYPGSSGAVLGYQTLDGKGKITGTSRVTLLDIQKSGSAIIYKVKSESWDDKNKPQQTGEYSMKCENGEFTMDMKSFVDPKSMEGFKDMEVTFSGTDMVYPSRMQPGDVLPDANITIGAASGGLALMKLTVSITNRKVESIETITVPAGTFECYKITYDVETKMGLKISSVAAQWMNKGAGNIKTETYDKKGKLLGSTLLTEFKP